jgi:hypothetical protein
MLCNVAVRSSLSVKTVEYFKKNFAGTIQVEKNIDGAGQQGRARN